MRATILVLALVILAGCLVHNDPFPVNVEGPDAILTVTGHSPDDVDAIAVDDAISRVGGDPVLISGSLLIDDAQHNIWLCSAIAWGPPNDPPQPPFCDGTSLGVEVAGDPSPGFNPSAVLTAAAVTDLQTIANVRWAEDASLFGTLAWPPGGGGG